MVQDGCRTSDSTCRCRFATGVNCPGSSKPRPAVTPRSPGIASRQWKLGHRDFEHLVTGFTLVSRGVARVRIAGILIECSTTEGATANLFLHALRSISGRIGVRIRRCGLDTLGSRLSTHDTRLSALVSPADSPGPRTRTIAGYRPWTAERPSRPFRTPTAGISRLVSPVRRLAAAGSSRRQVFTG